MLAELGYKFSLQGADEGRSKMDGLGSSFAGMSRNVDMHGSAIQRKLDMTAQHFSRFASGIQRSLGLAKVVIGALVAGKALGGIADWVKGDPEADKWKDFLRAKGMEEKQLAEYEGHLTRLRGNIACVQKGDYWAGVYGSQSIFDISDTDRNKQAVESMLNMAKGMSPTTTINEARDMARVFSTAFGAGKGPDEKLALIEKFGAQIPELLKRSTAEASDLVTGMSHVASLYADLGLSPSEMLADMGAVAGVLRQGTGEFLKSYLGKRGEGFGKFAGAVGEEEQLERWGVKTKSELPKHMQEWLKKSVAITTEKAPRFAGELLAKNPDEYHRVTDSIMKRAERLRLKRGFDKSGKLGEAYGETAVRGIPAYIADRVSGDHGKRKAALDEVDSAAQLQNFIEKQKSFTAQHEIFIQKSKDLSAAIKKPFQALGIELMKPYGAALDRIRENWTKNTEKMEANASSFAQTFLGSFSVAFGPLPGIDSTLKSIADSLGDPDPEKWKQIGAEMGNLAGTNLAPLVSGLKNVASVAKELMGYWPSIKEAWEWTGGWAVEGYKQYKNELLPGLATNMDHFRLAPAENFWKPLPAPLASAEVAPIIETLRTALQSLFGGGQGAPQPPTINVEVHPRIQVGTREIEDIAVESVEAKARGDYTASRRGFGEAFGW